ncbi:hypothetical protein SAMN05444275_106253 [Myroides odoratimimus subsp. xuanwuensis]|nr:hypothetical protein SAMN05444275_106253 [Myroides odoratimimus subsp. xuanwuensis]
MCCNKCYNTVYNLLIETHYITYHTIHIQYNTSVEMQYFTCHTIHTQYNTTIEIQYLTYRTIHTQYNTSIETITMKQKKRDDLSSLFIYK